MPVRPLTNKDRAQVLTLLGDPRTIDSPSNHLHVAEENGVVVGAVVWVQPSAGEEALLGAVAAPAGRRDLFYELVKATAEDAVSRGFSKAIFTIRRPALLQRIERDFTITAEASGWNPTTHQPVQWDVHVDLKDALQQLQQAGV